MRDAHLDGADLRLRARRQATTPSATQKAGQEHHAALEHDPLWDGAIFGGRGGYDREGVRSLRQEGFGSQPTGGAGGGHGQPRRPQAHSSEGARGAKGLRAFVPAFLLSGPQPHRRGLRQDQAPLTGGLCQEQRGVGGGDGGGALSDQYPRRPGLLRACWIPSCGSTTVKRAVSSGLACQEGLTEFRDRSPSYTREPLPRGESSPSLTFLYVRHCSRGLVYYWWIKEPKWDSVLCPLRVLPAKPPLFRALR